MTRAEYIRQLEFSLNGKLPKHEIREILRDYSEYFEAGKAEGKTEEEIAVSLGIPSAAAAEILAENEEEKQSEEEKPKFWESWWSGCKERFQAIWERIHSSARRTGRPARISWQKLLTVALAVLLMPFALMLLGFGLFLVACLALCLVGLAVLLLMAALTCGFFFLAGCSAAGFVAGALPGSALAATIAGLGALLAAGVLCVCLGIQLFRFMVRLVRYSFGYLPSRIKSARNPAWRAKRLARDGRGDAWQDPDAIISQDNNDGEENDYV